LRRPPSAGPKSLFSEDTGSCPAPGELGVLDPLIETWRRGRSFVRCHDLRFAPRTFNPGFGLGRFHPLRDLAGHPVPTMYAADQVEGALSETVFHDIPVRGPLKSIPLWRLAPLGLSSLSPLRALTLAQLYGLGLPRLGLTREELIASPAEEYPQTVLWARALHARRPDLDGLIWVSRQNDACCCLVLFGDRVGEKDLRTVRRPISLTSEKGLAYVREAARAAGISIID